MSRNIELKARVAGLAAVRARLGAMPRLGEHFLIQTDTFFFVKRGRLKLRQLDDGTGELIFYERPDQAEAKLSRYERMPCEDPRVVLRTLSIALGVRGVVRKRRHVILVGNTRVHLDEVDRLGSFVELEVVLGRHESISSGNKTAADLFHALGIPASDLVSCAYIDLLEPLPGL